jgi:hypothetical protein
VNVFVLYMYVYVSLINVAVLCMNHGHMNKDDKGTCVVEVLTMFSYNLWFSQHLLPKLPSSGECILVEIF